MMDDITYSKRFVYELVPIQTPSEKREVRRQYYAKNKDRILMLSRENRANTPIVRCEVCDKEVIKYNLNLHNKSQKHISKTGGIEPVEKKDDEQKKWEKELREFEKWQKGNIQKVKQLRELVRRNPDLFEPVRLTFN